MKLSTPQLRVLGAEMNADAKRRAFASLRAEGRAAHLDDAALGAEIDRLFRVAETVGFTSAHEKARLVQLVFALTDAHRRSPLCVDLVRGVLAAVHTPEEVRMDFLFRHVLPKRSWPDAG